MNQASSSQEKSALATLFIVATPIGNLADISARAIETLKSVDLILAEDTRHSKPLLQHYCINTPCVSYHDHSSEEQVAGFLRKLGEGQNLALISDAGTPLISDPGYRLVHLAREAGIQVSPIPGACALVAALSVSGLASDSFVFQGFLPAKSKARQEKLQLLANESRTVVMYESTHRIVEFLKDCEQVLPDSRQIVLGREISKKFETFLSGSATELLAKLQQDADQQKGEFVVLIDRAEQQQLNVAEMDGLLKLLLEELPIKTAAKIAAKYSGLNKKELYDRAMQLKG